MKFYYSAGTVALVVVVGSLISVLYYLVESLSTRGQRKLLEAKVSSS